MRSVPGWLLGWILVAFGSVASAADGVVALQTADPSCADDSGKRYVDCGNGTVTDNDTGLVWLANANCFGESWDWINAKVVARALSDLPDDHCDRFYSNPDECDCGLRDGSSPGEWRLPSIEEWRQMVEDATERPCIPVITNDTGDGCWTPDCVSEGTCSFRNLQPYYWSSSSLVADSTRAYWIFLRDGSLNLVGVMYGHSIWPVRGGQ